MGSEDGWHGSPQDGRELGELFEAVNASSSGGDVGEAFAKQNAVAADETFPAVRATAEKRRRRRWIWIGAAVVLALLAVVLIRRHGKGAAGGSAGGGPGGAKGGGRQTGSAAGGGRGGAQGGPAAITVGQAKTGDINIYVNALGTVTPTYTVTVYSQITGRVVGVHYREGQMIRRGDPLVDIDPRPYQATLTQAEGTLEHDQGLLAEAKIDLDRYQQAFARNAIARQQLEDQQQIVKQYEGTVKADQGSVDYDRVQLSYCHIVAPITGRAGLRLVDPGNTVFAGSGSTLVVLTQVQPITVVFNVSEDDLPQVQEQLRGGRKLEVDAFDRTADKRLEAGTLGALDNQVDTATGTVRFRAGFANKGLILFPNQFVNARLLLKTLRGVTLVPSGAVQHNGTAAFVYVVKPDQTAAVQPVDVLTSDEQTTAVKGVGAGTQLATSGFDRLEGGTKVLVHGQSAGNAQGHGSNGASGGDTGGSSGGSSSH